MISGIRLEGKLLLRLKSFFSKFLYFSFEDDSGCVGTVDTASFNGDEEMSTVLEEMLAVHTHNSSLIGLGNISEDDIDHTDEESVFKRLSGVSDDRDDVVSLLGHVNQISTTSVREFNSVDCTGRSNDISNVGNSSSRGSTCAYDKNKILRRRISKRSSLKSFDDLVEINIFYKYLYLSLSPSPLPQLKANLSKFVVFLN